MAALWKSGGKPPHSRRRREESSGGRDAKRVECASLLALSTGAVCAAAHAKRRRAAALQTLTRGKRLVCKQVARYLLGAS